MLVNLVPEFLATLAAPDPTAAYHEYLDHHRPLLSAYWQNYVLDPAAPKMVPKPGWFPAPARPDQPRADE